MAGRIEGNELRADLEEIGRKVGHRFAVNTVVNSRRELVALFAGDPVAAHRAGVRFARKVYSTRFPPPADIAVFNAYPKDTDLVQVLNSMNAVARDLRRAIKPDGSAVLATACTHGPGIHYLLSSGMRAHGPLKRERIHLGKNGLIIFSPNLSYADIEEFPQDTCLFNSWAGGHRRAGQTPRGPGHRFRSSPTPPCRSRKRSPCWRISPQGASATTGQSYFKEQNSMTSETQRTVQPEDLFQLQFLQDAKLSPSGKQVAYCISHVDTAQDEEYCAIWVLSPQTGEARQLTDGLAVDSNPVWSPDERQIAFFSNRSGGKATAYDLRRRRRNANADRSAARRRPRSRLVTGWKAYRLLSAGNF